MYVCKLRQCQRDNRLAEGRLIRFFMTTGQTGDFMGTAALLGSLPRADCLLADRGYDADQFRETAKDKETSPCILRRNSRRRPATHDWQ